VLKKTKEGEGEMHNDCCSYTPVFGGQENVDHVFWVLHLCAVKSTIRQELLSCQMAAVWVILHRDV